MSDDETAQTLACKAAVNGCVRGQMLRSAREVISELLAEKMRIVTKFPAGVRDTGNRIEDLIPGTAVFAGGSGLWRGPHCFGPLPDFFPESPVLILGHNFDSEAGYQSSRQRGENYNRPTPSGVYFWPI